MKRSVQEFLARSSQAALATAILISLATDAPAQRGAVPASSTGAPSRASTVAIAVPWRGDPLDWHLTWSGATTLLQGIARVEPGCSLVSAEWDPGDGSGYIPISTANPRILELGHVYTTPHHGTTFQATLRVTDNCGTTSTDTFRVLVLDETLGVEASRALDHGLWHLHKQLTLSSSGGGSTRATGRTRTAVTSRERRQAWRFRRFRRKGTWRRAMTVRIPTSRMSAGAWHT